MFAKNNRYSFKNKLPKNILNSPSFSIRYGKNDEGLKVAVVVSKKVDKRAVVRNKIKRKILESVRASIKTETFLDLVFYARKQAASFENLGKEVEEALNKVTN